jgi:hypothetical protein
MDTKECARPLGGRAGRFPTTGQASSTCHSTNIPERLLGRFEPLDGRAAR